MSQVHQKQLESYLESALERLELAYDKVIATQGFNRDTEKLKLLIEMTKEQVPNENSDHSAR